MRVIKPSVKQIAFSITKAFEGGDWGSVAGNFDGQILSVGALQWNIGQGTLYPLIVHAYETKADLMRQIFGAAADYIVAAAKKRDREPFLMMLDPSGRVRKDWRILWSAWGHAFKDVQQTVGASPYHEKAQQIVAAFGFQTIRAYVWAFDLTVQNGGMGKLMRTALRTILRFKKTPTERDDLRHLTMARGALVKSEFYNDYLMRKLAIIDGRGVVHGTLFELDRDYGLSDDPCWEPEETEQNNHAGSQES